MAKTKIFINRLQQYALEYIDECESKRKEQLSNKGEIVGVAERKMPTIDYFLKYWVPKHYKEKATINRATYYRWLNWDNGHKKTVITSIDDLFKAIQIDIVANEGKGLAYIKHKFGWADKSEQTIKTEQPLFPENNKPMD